MNRSTSSPRHPQHAGRCAGPTLTHARDRNDLLSQLRLAEGQVHDIQHMVESGCSCQDIAAQLAAARSTLDSSCLHMTACFVTQELANQVVKSPADRQQLSEVLSAVQHLLGKTA